MASSRARREVEPEAYPLGYVEDCGEPRTTLEDCFTVRLPEEGHDGQTDE
jgi:hypothetical protein